MTAPDSFDSPDGRSTPETAGQAAYEAYARKVCELEYDRIAFPAWDTKTNVEMFGWSAAAEAGYRAIAAAAPAPAGEGGESWVIIRRPYCAPPVAYGPLSADQVARMLQEPRDDNEAVSAILLTPPPEQPQAALDLARAEAAGIRAAAANTARDLAEARTALLEIARAAQGSIDGNVAPDLNWFVGEALHGLGELCRTCNGSGLIEVPASDGESASEQACPDCNPPECLASHCPPSMYTDCEYPKCVPADGRHPDGCTCQFCREDERGERARLDREELDDDGSGPTSQLHEFDYLDEDDQ